MIDVLMSAAGCPGRTGAYTPSVSDSPLLAAQGGQKARIGAGVFLDDLQPAVIVQQPAEGLRRIGVLEVHADALAALQLDLFAGNGRRKIAGSAEVTGDQVQSLMPRIGLLIESDLAVRVGDAYRGQQRREKLAGRRIVAPRHGFPGIVNFAVDDQKVSRLHALRHVADL